MFIVLSVLFIAFLVWASVPMEFRLFLRKYVLLKIGVVEMVSWSVVIYDSVTGYLRINCEFDCLTTKRR